MSRAVPAALLLVALMHGCVGVQTSIKTLASPSHLAAQAWPLDWLKGNDGASQAVAFCQNGVSQSHACCAASCGICDGVGCGSRPGGAKQCCADHFESTCTSASQVTCKLPDDEMNMPFFLSTNAIGTLIELLGACTQQGIRKPTAEQTRAHPSSRLVSKQEDATPGLSESAAERVESKKREGDMLVSHLSRLGAGLAVNARKQTNRTHTGSIYPAQGFADLVGHVYVICNDDCEAITVPSSWSGKVSLVDGHKSDACMQDFLREDAAIALGLYMEKVWRHAAAVTLAHKLAVMDAHLNNYSSIAIFEDDIEFQRVDFSFDDASELLQREDWSLMRLGSSPWAIAPPLGENKCYDECKCEATREGLCVMREGCVGMHSSAAYILSSRAFRPFVEAGGIIDIHVLGSLPSIVFTPPLAYQFRTAADDDKGDHGIEKETELYKAFSQNCIVADARR